MTIKLFIITLSCVAALFLLVTGYILFLPIDSSEFGFNITYEGRKVPVWHAVVIFLFIVVGTTSGIMAEYIFSSGRPLSSFKLSSIFLKSTTPLTIFVSALVFMFVFPSLYVKIGDVSTYFSAFQTAFMFRQLFSAALVR